MDLRAIRGCAAKALASSRFPPWVSSPRVSEIICYKILQNEAAAFESAYRRAGAVLQASTLMDCMAAIPCSGGSLASAFMTKVEKAKNTPAIVPSRAP
jgi:hypothetical protein